MNGFILASLVLTIGQIVALNLSFSDNDGIGCDCHCHHDSNNSIRTDHSPDRSLSSPESTVTPEAFSRQSGVKFDQPKTLLRPSNLKRNDHEDDDEDDNNADTKQPDHGRDAQQVQRSSSNKNEPIRVTVVFESLCRFSRYHIVSTFWDVVKALPNNTALWSSPADERMWHPRLVDNLLLELLPFGNVEYDSHSGSVTCQNGPHECFVDRLQACVLKHIPGMDAFQYIVCTAYNALQKDKNGVTRNTSLKEFENLCFNADNEDHPSAKRSHFSDLILPCINSTEPRKLHDEIWNRLKKSPHQFVPWVEINNDYKDKARHHLLDEICAAAHGRDPENTPSICKIKGQGQILSSRSNWDIDESSVSLRPWRLRSPLLPQR